MAVTRHRQECENPVVRPSLQTRLEWFSRGAASLARVFPNIAADTGVDEVYACPLCLGTDVETGKRTLLVFPRAAVRERFLTAEHVPPKSFGGKALVLTCARCNSGAGTELDAHARNRENPVDVVLLGRKIKPRRVRLTVGEDSVEADIVADGSNIDLCVGERRRRQPRDLTRREAQFRDALAKAIAEERELGINFIGDRYSERRARVSWLRSAYLSLFAIMGYRYALAPALDLVRRQIREPEVEHIPTFLAVLKEPAAWSERGIHIVEDGAGAQYWAVRMGRYLAFLPDTPDDHFYERLAVRSRGNRGVIVSSRAFTWPSMPTFGEGFMRTELAVPPDPDSLNR